MPSASSPDAADRILHAEREHLRSSRRYLELMRTDVLSLRAMGGDPVSEEYLKADLYRRAEALRDLPDTPLFFGRLDYRPGALLAGDTDADDVRVREDQPDGEHFHVGRRHVHDSHGTPVVIDWRAPVSRPFYRASQAEPMGLELRRRFGFAGGELTAFEDEQFGAGLGRPSATSRILIEEIERPRSGPMRDIVATIQPDQDDIVRAGVEATVCVQGAPGTGKTAVGLHRVAYLLYAHAQRLGRGGVLVVGPNNAFLAYIRNVLPALGELDVAQLSVADLTAAVPVRGTDSEQAAQVKGDARMAQVLASALWEQLAEPAEPIMLARGSRRWRVPASEIAELAAELRARGVRYGTGRDMLGHRIAHVILTRMEAAGETCDDRTHESVRRTRQVQNAVAQVWPKADPVRMVFRLLSEPDLLKRAADGLLDADEQALISWANPPRGPGSARWSAADAVLIDEMSDLIERTPSLAHIVVDEAQDLSPMQCRAIGRRCATGSATVLGDIAQGTTAWATTSWDQMLGHLGKPDADLRVLDTGYRVPRQILDFASQLLGQIAPELRPASSVRQDPGALMVTQVTDEGALLGALVAACTEALGLPGSAAVIAADNQIPSLAAALAAAGLPHAILDGVADGELISLVPVSLAKGLEFDQVIVCEPAQIASAEARGLNRLYVALTRAVSRLTVLHAQPLPAALA
ncbi:MAG TPA: ATP-binding domain-containing protein [Streptosporangiaceae bacterium]|nr:ATP-binding domain-containing protein [Streptosporangiaceae bacterium]